MWSENRDACDVFVACNTQWRVASNGLVLGLDYVALESVINIKSIENTADTFERVQILEREQLMINREKSATNN